MASSRDLENSDLRMGWPYQAMGLKLCITAEFSLCLPFGLCHEKLDATSEI